MNKTIRILIAILSAAAILFLARGRMAGAGGIGTGRAAEPEGQSVPAPLRDPGDPGSVRPPPVAVPPITGPGTYSVGGVCTFIVIQMAEPVSLHAELLPYAVLGVRPDNIANYLAGVCKATYVKVGVGVIDLAPQDGSVKICFAAVPNTTGTIYVYNDKTWTALTTTVENGLACAPAQQTGKYVLVVEK